MRISYINTSAEFVEPLDGQQDEEASILKMLAYFDVFQYPLTKNEIIQFAGQDQQGVNIDRKLKELLGRQSIFLHLGFYSLHDNPLLAHRRTERNNRAVKLLPRAIGVGKFLFRFPFVRAVAIAGSLSKNFADTEADIEFFIITKANRLWIARSFIHLFKKAGFFAGKQYGFCINCIDEEAMLIENQNIFTAIEIATLMPVSGKEKMDNFFERNHWTQQLFPTAATRKPGPTNKRHWLKKFIEVIFDNAIGNWMDDWLLKIATRHKAKKDKKVKRNKDCDMTSLTMSKHILHSHPYNLQDKALSLYNQKLSDLKLS